MVTGIGFAGLLVAGYFVIDDPMPGHHSGVAEPPEVPYDIPSRFVIGEWEDTIGSWTQRIRIVEWGGYLCREIHYPDGRLDRDIIKEIAPEAANERRFKNLSSPNGQAYAITPHGHLAIYDADGYVGMAINVAARGEVR